MRFDGLEINWIACAFLPLFGEMEKLHEILPKSLLKVIDGELTLGSASKELKTLNLLK